MEIKELNLDPERPHHYFICVAVKPMVSDKPGEMFLKYRPFHISNSQIEKLQDVVMLSRDELFKTTEKEALEIHSLKDLVSSFSMLKIAAKINQCTMHHFSSEHEIDEEWFDLFVNQANNNKRTKEKLLDARISY